MKIAILGLTVVGAFGESPVAEKFEEFKKKFKKTYKNADEELARFKIFVRNVEAASNMASMDSGAKYGHMSPLADLSEEEFAKLNNMPVTPEVLRLHEAAAEKHKNQYVVSEPRLPSGYDWREKGAVVDVKNQAQCGSCWAFATAANIEGQNFIVNGKLQSLSEQELVDCDGNDNGCNGGLPSNAYKDLIAEKMGLELESDYEYVAQEGACKAKASLEKVFLKGWLPISSIETEMAAALMKYGPLAIGINAGPMQLYMGGIADPFFCNPIALDHGVVLVAFGTEYGKEFWTIRNSWGPEWGESGYYRIIRGKGKCGLNRMVTTALVAPSTEKPQIYV